MPDRLDKWMAQSRQVSSLAPAAERDRAGVRFAFYGRMSTVEHQDRSSSCGWQREVADELVNSHGPVVAEFFDVGCSRRLPWSSRPEASALLMELSSPERRFDAVVVGEYERAFSGDQFMAMAALFGRHGVQVWLPEAGGRVDLGGSDASGAGYVVGRAIAAGGAAVPAPGSGCDAYASSGAGSILGWAAAVRLSAGRRGCASEPGRMRVGGGGCVGWILIRRRRRSCGGCSSSAWLDGAWPALRGS